MIARILDWIDEAAAGLIRLAYLAAGITAVAVYFGAGHLPPNVEATLNAGLPWVLAFSVETHTYLSARRVRAAWQDRQAATAGTPERERARGALRVNLAVLAGLLAFSCWNQFNYLAATWTPPLTALVLPGWVAYVVRALIVPAAFMAAAFLAPLAEPITAQIEAEARATLADVFKIARKQRRRLLRDAERSGRDMTGALVELVPDPETRRIIAHAYGAIGGNVPALAVAAPADHLPGAGGMIAPAVAPIALPAPTPDPPPTGPGSPAAGDASKHGKPGKAGRADTAAIQLVEPPEWRDGTRPRRRTASAEQRVRRILAAEPTISTRQLAKRARVSDSTASKWRQVVTTERAITGRAGAPGERPHALAQ